MKLLSKHIYKIFLPTIVVFVLLFFLSAVSNLDNGKSDEDKKQLEELLNRAVVSCYSIEGAYPQSIEHIIENYGIQYNEEEYVIKYEFYASNLKPDITVLER
ncbi:MAG: hypothetical protein J6L23_02000 [Clostridia bacterium]|nr:hypothetical protein [Clostridia bacterium]MBQ6905974.1 hypothetical protein [Clostridia bacterium]